MNRQYENVFITGGAGYVGSALIPRLLDLGYRVSVYDLFIYGDTLENHRNLKKIKADIRDEQSLIKSSKNHDAFIHLACISNDPSFDLNPKLGKSINFDAFFNVLNAVRSNDVGRFILASSTSQYGIVSDPNARVTEQIPANPQSDYAKFKLECEKLTERADLECEYVFVRPSTLCGYAPRLRLDLVVNIFTHHALENRKIKVFNGNNIRAALDIRDMVRFYELTLESFGKDIDRQAFNVSYKSAPIRELAYMVKNALNDKEIEIEEVKNDDNRSFPVDATKAREKLGFECEYTIEDAVISIKNAYDKGKIKDFNNSLFYNIKRMKEIDLK